MNTPRRYRIVVALDGSQYSDIVLEHALDQAARHDAVDLHLVTILNNAVDIAPTKRWLAAAAHDGLDAFVEHRERWRTRLHVRVGKPAEEVPILAAEVAADLLVIGNYGVHAHRRSVAARIVEATPCATLVVGLTGQEVEAVPQCPACVAVREASDGSRWFCEAHASDVELRLSTLLSTSLPLIRGGTMW